MGQVGQNIYVHFVNHSINQLNQWLFHTKSPQGSNGLPCIPAYEREIVKAMRQISQYIHVPFLNQNTKQIYPEIAITNLASRLTSEKLRKPWGRSARISMCTSLPRSRNRLAIWIESSSMGSSSQHCKK